MTQGVSINFYIGESGLASVQTGAAADVAGGVVGDIAFEPTLEPSEVLESPTEDETALPFSTSQMNALAEPVAPDTSSAAPGFRLETEADQPPVDIAVLEQTAAEAEQAAADSPLEPSELDPSGLPLAEGSLTGFEPPRDPEEMEAMVDASDEPSLSPVEPELWADLMDAESSMPMDLADLEVLSSAGIGGSDDPLPPMDPAEIEAMAAGQSPLVDAPPPDLVPTEDDEKLSRQTGAKTSGRRSGTTRTKKSD